MRILFVLHQFFPEFAGGTERVTLNLARMAQRAGHYVHVLACAVQEAPHGGAAQPQPGLEGSVDTVYQGLPVTLIRREDLPPTGDYSLEVSGPLAQSLHAWITTMRFDIAHVMHTMRMATAVRAVQLAGVPYVMTLTDYFPACSRIGLVDLAGNICEGPEGGRRCSTHCMVPPWTPESFVQRYRQGQDILEGASACTAPSQYVADRYRSAYPTVEVRVMAHGIDLLKLLDVVPEAPRPQDDRPLTLAYAGTIVPEKGLHIVVQALAKIPDAPVQLKAAGPLHGPLFEREEIRRLCERDDRVEMLGPLPFEGVARLLADADLLCIPSLVPESYSLVLREAFALGLPALVSDVGAAAEAVREAGCGQLVPMGDVAAWAAAIEAVAQRRDRVDIWRERVPLPPRLEEEAFMYESLYRQFALSV